MRRMTWVLLLLAVVATVSVQASTIQTPTTLVAFSTGSDGTSLLSDGSTDPNYQFYYFAAGTPWSTLVQIPGAYPNGAAPYVVNANGFPYSLQGPNGPIPGWLSDYGVNNLAKWIAPQADYSGQTQSASTTYSPYTLGPLPPLPPPPPGPPEITYGTDPEGWYVWMTQFYIPDNYALNTIVLSGAMSSDNCTFDVLINGGSTGMAMQDGTCLGSAHPFRFTEQGAVSGAAQGAMSWSAAQTLFTSTANFIYGWNTLQLIVQNNPGGSANPTGLAAWLQLEGEIVVVPEASTIALMTLGLGALALFRRKK